MHINGRLICVTDSDSRRYNRIIDPDFIADPDWTDSEEMPQVVGLVIDHNSRDVYVKGSGSCAFMHAETSQIVPGSTVASAQVLEALVGWLDPARYPVLIQLPTDEAHRLAGPWGLPVEREN